MTNPFHELEAVGGKGFWGLVPKDRSKWEKAAWSQAQAEYAARAINQHEKLVAVVRCLLLSADAAWEADAGGHDWPEACQLARALLKEEKP